MNIRFLFSNTKILFTSFFLLILLSWKIVRGIFELVVLWDLYVFFILILALISILVILTKKTIKLDLVSLLILISLSVYAVSLLSFRNINNAFTLGMTCLAGYFSMHIVLKKISDVTFHIRYFFPRM